MSMNCVARGELLDAGLLIGQAVVAQVEVAVALVRVAAARAAAAVADLDDDEAELREALRHRRSPRTVFDTLSVCGPGYTFAMIGYFFVRIEVERLPHVAVNVGHAIGGLHDERLGQLPADLLQSADIGRSRDR